MRYYIEPNKVGIDVIDRQQPGHDPIARCWDIELANKICADLNAEHRPLKSREEYQ